MNAPTSSVRKRNPRAVLPMQPRRAGRFAWAVMVHLVLALLLGAPALHPPPHLAAGGEPGVRPRDAVELFAARPRDGAAAEVVPQLRRVQQPPRIGADAAPFAPSAAPELAANESSTPPAQATAPDPRGARRPAYYANAPPSPGNRLLT